MDAQLSGFLFFVLCRGPSRALILVLLAALARNRCLGVRRRRRPGAADKFTAALAKAAAAAEAAERGPPSPASLSKRAALHQDVDTEADKVTFQYIFISRPRDEGV